MNHQAAIIKAARRKGKDPTGLSSAEYLGLSLGIRTTREKLADAAAAVKARAVSAAATVLPSLVVPAATRDFNLTVCRSNLCGSYGHLADGAEVCHRCNCAGRNLASKAEQRDQSCPDGRWDNRRIDQ